MGSFEIGGGEVTFARYSSFSWETAALDCFGAFLSGAFFVVVRDLVFVVGIWSSKLHHRLCNRFAFDLSNSGSSSAASAMAGGANTDAASAVTLNGTALAFASRDFCSLGFGCALR